MQMTSYLVHYTQDAGMLASVRQRHGRNDRRATDAHARITSPLCQMTADVGEAMLIDNYYVQSSRTLDSYGKQDC